MLLLAFEVARLAGDFLRAMNVYLWTEATVAGDLLRMPISDEGSRRQLNASLPHKSFSRWSVTFSNIT